VNTHAQKTYTLDQLNIKEFTGELYSRYGKKLYSYGINTWKLDEDSAWDLIYKTLYKVIDTYKRYHFESEEKFASFIFRIFINYLKNNYQEQKKLSESLQIQRLDNLELQNKPENNPANEVQSLKMTLMREELEKMEDWQKILLLMRIEGHPYSEIANYINKPVEHLKVYYQRFKEQLTKKINERL
jgi:RNA polymerase sigma-70 factor (ECF subfamily)